MRGPPRSPSSLRRANVTHGYSAAALAELLPAFALIAERDAELPGIVDDKPIASKLFVLRRAAG